MGGAYRKLRNAYKILVKTHKGKASLRLLQGRWEGTIEMDPTGTGYEDLDRNNVTQDRE
jgi:hypothetical protein